MNTTTLNNSPLNRHRFASRWLFIGCAVVFSFLLVQAVTYSGIIEALAEWQFARFGRYFPVLTLLALLGLFAVLWMVVSRIRRRLRKQTVMIDPAIRDIRGIANAANFLFVSAGLAGMLALGSFVHYLQLPSTSGPVRTISIARGTPALAIGGPVRFTNIRSRGPIARYSEDFLFWRNTRYLAPVGTTRLESGQSAYDLFVEVPSQDARAVPTATSGLLRLSAVPPEVAQMYTNAGYATSRQSAVLFASGASAYRSTLVLMGELVMFGLLATIFALGLRRRERRRVHALGLE